MKKTWHRLAVAVVLSLAVHAAAISFSWYGIPQLPEEPLPLAVRIVPAGPPVVTPPRPRDTASPPKPRVAEDVAVVTPERPAQNPSPQRESPSASAPAPFGLMVGPVRPEEVAGPPSAPEPSTAAPEPIVVATAPSSTLPTDTRPLPAFPRKGRITYNLVYGRDRFPVGLTVQYWELDGTRYQLASRSETSGIVDLIRSQHRTYSSRGDLTPDGLKPEVFLMSRDRGRGPEEARAYFNWLTGTLTLGSATEQRQHVLPRGGQDLLSFMYQLALDPPPPGRLRVPVTNGTRIETFELDVLPEEKIETPLGVLRALPVRQVRAPGTEGVDVWLAIEYRHLPVRIRFYGRDGEATGEQLVTEIRLSED